jgi:hypothetical protein
MSSYKRGKPLVGGKKGTGKKGMPLGKQHTMTLLKFKINLK